MKKRYMSLAITCLVVASLFTGCNNKNYKDSKVNTKTSQQKKLNYDEDSLKDVITKMANTKYYGGISLADLAKFMSTEDANDAYNLLSDTGKNYIDITLDIQDYIKIKEDRDKDIKNNPDKTYAEYKKRMSNQADNGYDADTGFETYEDEPSGDDSDSDKQIMIKGMQKDLILPDGTVIWKGISKRQAKIADADDIKKYKKACEEYNNKLAEILEQEEESGVENQSYKKSSKSLGVTLCSTRSVKHINNMMTKKEWEDAYKPYPNTMDERITKEGDKYYVYYDSLSEDDKTNGFVVLDIYGFNYELDVSTDKFGGVAAKNNDDYLYEIGSYTFYDNGNCEITLSSNQNSFDIGFNIGDDSKMVDGVSVAKAIKSGIDGLIDETDEEDSNTETGKDLLNDAIE